MDTIIRLLYAYKEKKKMSGIFYPKKQGLYDPAFEHDSCGVGFIVHMKGAQSHPRRGRRARLQHYDQEIQRRERCS